MRHCGPLGRRRFGGADIHAAINGHGIERDDLRADPPCASSIPTATFAAAVGPVRNQRSRASGEERVARDVGSDGGVTAAACDCENAVNPLHCRQSRHYTPPSASAKSDRLARHANPCHRLTRQRLRTTHGGDRGPQGESAGEIVYDDAVCRRRRRRLARRSCEEAAEVVEAAGEPGRLRGAAHLIHEAADFVYHLFVMLGFRELPC